jgi:ATP-dependent DNA helicase RecQ
LKTTPLHILEQYWKLPGFRPLQEEIIQSVLAGNDTLALLPTGGGKSICFQVPGIILEGLCLVISPLIALMRDQVDGLNNKGIRASSLHSGLNYYEVKERLINATEGEYQFLYCSPERLESKLFQDYLHLLPIRLLVIDEAHCISQWGYDFRPPYLRIAATRRQLKNIPLIALTASATPPVQADIVKQLGLKNAHIFKQSFDRPNLSYSCFKVDSKLNKIQAILEKVPGTSIVYCNNRRQTKKVAEALSLQGISADFYHAGLSQETREQKQQAWISNKIRVMVCTNAFGMGIDKPNVRTVIHHDLPDCLENYYQEAGRAGRDSKKAYAILLYQQKDLGELLLSAEKKFPPIKTIKQVYQSIADYLQIPVGNGEGLYYDFDLSEFTKAFKLEVLLVMNVFKVLEQEGHIQFSESIFLPTQVSFLVNKEGLAIVEQSYPELEPIIKALLRSYEGILNNRISVNEQSLAKTCSIKLEALTIALKKLAQHGIIEYLPKKETPQIHFLLNRAPAEYLNIQQDAYLQRKKLYEERVATMLFYANEIKTCRSKFIANYFGDDTKKDCGICDRCLDAKKSRFSDADFAAIEAPLKKLGKASIDLKQYMQLLKKYSEKKIWTVLDFLQSEEKIHISETKQISWLNKQKSPSL